MRTGRTTTETAGVSAAPFLTFDCESCACRGRVPVEDVAALVAGARSFFVTHASCRTLIDLTDTLYEGWRVPPRLAKA
jgi:hypothetical protein